MKKIKEIEDRVFTNNKGWLTIYPGFKFHRGKVGQLMGTACDDQGVEYQVVVANCSLPNCACAAEAVVDNALIN